MSNKLVRVLMDAGALRYGTIFLTSGKESNYYIDIKGASANPVVLSIISGKIVDVMNTLVEPVNAIAGIELGGVPIATAVSLELNMPMIIVRKKPKEYGIDKSFIGNADGKKIVILEDVTTTGGSVIKAIESLRENGGTINTVITVADRNEGAVESLGKIGVELISLIDDSELRGERNEQ